MADTTFTLAPAAQQGVLSYALECFEILGEHHDIRPRLEFIDRAYQREGNMGYDHLMSKLRNEQGDKSRIQDVSVPIVYTQVETALAYLTSVFLTGYPLFGIVARPSAPEDVAKMAETIILENSTRQGWVRHLLMWFRDMLKYNVGAIEVDWCEESVWLPITDLGFDAKVAKPKKLAWQGNKLRRLDLYNTVWDHRVNIAEVHSKGDYAGYVELISKVQLKQYLENLPNRVTANLQAAYDSRPTYEYFYVPKVNDDPLLPISPSSGQNWMAWAGVRAGTGTRYQEMYEKFTLYARIIPSEFNIRVPAPNQPQIWRFVIINNKVVVLAERMTNAHQWLPTIFGQPIEDGIGFGYQTKSFAQNVINSQEVASALTSARIQSARRRLTDRVAYDPTRIREADINSPSATAKIPVRPGAYGKPVQDALYHFPFDDRNSTLFTQEAQAVIELAGLVNGINRVQEGQFQRGNKTMREFQTVMANSNARLQMMALFIQSQALEPLKEIIKLNILQYQGEATYYNTIQREPVQIVPEELRKQSFAFTMTDGLLPADKILNSDFMQVFMQIASGSQELMMEYDLAAMFAYFYREQGMRLTLSDFKRSDEEKQQLIQQLSARTAAEAQAAASGQAAGQPALPPAG